MIYITSDIHNRWTYLKRLLEYVDFSDADELIINGDLFDRNLDMNNLLDFLYSHKNVNVILGNHELMFMDAYCDEQINQSAINNYIDYSYGEVDELVIKDSLIRWINNGGLKTYRELMKRSKETGEDEVVKLYKYLQEKPYYIVKENCVITHCGPSIDLDTYTISSVVGDLEQKKPHEIVWNRLFYKKYIRLSRMGEKMLKCNIIIGHTAVEHINQKFFRTVGDNFLLNININSVNALSLLDLKNMKLYIYYYDKDSVSIVKFE